MIRAVGTGFWRKSRLPFLKILRHRKKGVSSCLSASNATGNNPGPFLPNVRCGFFDQRCNLLGPRDVDRVAGARDFDRVALGSCGVPPFEVGIDGSVFRRYQHPAWFASPRSLGDDRLKIVSEGEHLRSRHESGLLRREIGGELLMKLRGVEVGE